MAIEIKKDVENKLLQRKEIEAVIDSEGATLSRQAIRKEIAKKLKVDEKLVIVNHAKNHFGDMKVSVVAKVYETEESLKKHARPHMVKRNIIEEPQEEAGAEE